MSTLRVRGKEANLILEQKLTFPAVYTGPKADYSEIQNDPYSYENMANTNFLMDFIHLSAFYTNDFAARTVAGKKHHN